MDWTEQEPYGRKIHVWENQHGDELYIRDSPKLINTNLIRKQNRYELRLKRQHTGRYGLPMTEPHGSFEDEQEAVDAAIEMFNIE